jgi:hypothetical protein
MAKILRLVFVSVMAKILRLAFVSVMAKILRLAFQKKTDNVSSQNILLKYTLLLNAEDNNVQNKPNPTEVKALHLQYNVATY